MLRVSDAEWAEALRWAEALDCLAPDGRPSISQLVAGIGNGSIQVKRVKAVVPRSAAARIRAQLDLTPDAPSADIARMLDVTVMQVSVERRRYSDRKAAGEAMA